jgi:toxin-antitoxin system PIN domain toxin
VKLPDLNVLLYAIDEASPLHPLAREWLELSLSGTEEVAFAWLVLLGFLRLATNASVFEEPLTVEEALEVMAGWLAQPVARVVHPTAQHLTLLRRLLPPHGAAGNLASDAHLTALAIEHDAELCSHDRDFGRFAGLRWLDPLA